jgi:hypothetical protein
MEGNQMDGYEILLKAKGIVERATRRIEETMNVLEEIETDEILSQSIIGGDMQQKNILQQARDRVVQLEKEASEALEIKQKLEAMAKRQLEEKDRNAGIINMPRRLSGIEQITKFFGPTRVQQPEPPMSGDVAAWLRKNAPEKLPPVNDVPELTIEQRAKFAHNEYCDACYRLGAAKTELQQLEKKVADMAALMRCVEEEAA